MNTQRLFQSLRIERIDYSQAIALQQQLLDEVEVTGIDLLLLLEHPATITLGRWCDTRHLLTCSSLLQGLGIELCRAARGGDVTYHGPGQLIGYPLFDLNAIGRDLHRYLRLLEQVLIEVLAQWQILAERRQDHTGLWVGREKIVSIGIGVRRWISWHGFALNIGSDLSGFTHIVPCGLAGVTMTSMEKLLGRAVDRRAVEQAIIERFSQLFHRCYAGCVTDLALKKSLSR